MKKHLTILLVLLTVLLSACAKSEPSQPAAEVTGKKVNVNGGSYTDVNVVEMQTMLANKDFTFVNVHIPFEGDIEKTDLSIPYDQIEQNLEQLPAEKDARIVLYCRSGRMSTIAAEKLVELGYTNVWQLAGGMVAWEQAGLPIDR